jgi:hypothetical protein
VKREKGRRKRGNSRGGGAGLGFWVKNKRKTGGCGLPDGVGAGYNRGGTAALEKTSKNRRKQIRSLLRSLPRLRRVLDFRV